VLVGLVGLGGGHISLALIRNSVGQRPSKRWGLGLSGLPFVNQDSTGADIKSLAKRVVLARSLGDNTKLSHHAQAIH
jgi:hypothetical protein